MSAVSEAPAVARGGYEIDGRHIDDPTTPDAQQLLIRAHHAHHRPLCLCTRTGVAMYIAKTPRLLVIKRMPGTAGEHDRACGSWLPPEALSGLGQVLGAAIDDNPDDGTTALRLGFSLSKNGSGPPPAESGEPSDTVAADGAKLSLRATLHYLWDEAGFTSWTPQQVGRRQWRVISDRLAHAAAGKTAKRKPLADKLFLPESFDPDDKARITARRLTAWAPAREMPGKPTQLMILVGEVQAFEPARFGHKLVIKHMPDAPIIVDEDLAKRIEKRFGYELALADALPDTHLIAILTFSVTRTGLAHASLLSLMLTDSHWLPIDNEYDHLLIDTAVSQHRSFTIGLRYNLKDSTPVARMVLTDTDPATAIYLADPDEDTAEFTETISAEGLTPLVWPTDTDLPDLPPTAVQHQLSPATPADLSPTLDRTTDV